MLKIHYQIESTENIHMYFHKTVEIIKPMDWNKFSNFEIYTSEPLRAHKIEGETSTFKIIIIIQSFYFWGLSIISVK